VSTTVNNKSAGAEIASTGLRPWQSTPEDSRLAIYAGDVGCRTTEEVGDETRPDLGNGRAPPDVQRQRKRQGCRCAYGRRDRKVMRYRPAVSGLLRRKEASLEEFLRRQEQGLERPVRSQAEERTVWSVL